MSYIILNMYFPYDYITKGLLIINSDGTLNVVIRLVLSDILSEIASRYEFS